MASIQPLASTLCSVLQGEQANWFSSSACWLTRALTLPLQATLLCAVRPKQAICRWCSSCWAILASAQLTWTALAGRRLPACWTLPKQTLLQRRKTKKEQRAAARKAAVAESAHANNDGHGDDDVDGDDDDDTGLPVSMSTVRQMGQIFARYESVDPTIEDDDPLVAAAAGGHVAVVQRLLADPRVDPSEYGLYSSMDVVMKCRDGAAAAAVLELLLAHPRVRAAEGLLPCIESKRLALLQRLLREPRVHEAPGRASAAADSRSSEAEASTAGRKPAEAEGAAGSDGAGTGSCESEFRYYVLHNAVAYVPATVVDCLLADPRTDPLAKDTSTRASGSKSKSKLGTGRGSGAGEGSGDDGGKDALDAAARYSFNANRPGVARTPRCGRLSPAGEPRGSARLSC